MTYHHKNHSLFIVGKKKHQAIAEFPIPPLQQGNSLTDLPIASEPIQHFSKVLPKNKQENPQKIDRITGIGIIDDKLFINAIKYYDAKGKNTDTSLILPDVNNLNRLPSQYFFALQGGAHAAGWISEVPQPWSNIFKANFIVGNASNTPIASRHSIGPSAFLMGLVKEEPLAKNIKTKALMDFSLANKLHHDTYNKTGKNDIWTVVSRASFGFIIPNSSTYAVFGSSGGHNSKIGYKIKQSNGHKCGGPCAEDPSDYYNYYWLFDLNDMHLVFQGKKLAHSVFPYEYGKFNIPFDRSINPKGGSKFHRISGATFDKHSKTLYLSLSQADHSQGNKPLPLLVTYKLAGF